MAVVTEPKREKKIAEDEAEYEFFISYPRKRYFVNFANSMFYVDEIKRMMNEILKDPNHEPRKHVSYGLIEFHINYYYCYLCCARPLGCDVLK